MENTEVLRLLDGLSVSDKQVELDLCMPPSTLGHIRKGSRGLPKKFEDEFMRYCSGVVVEDGVNFGGVLDYDTIIFGGEGLRLRVTVDLVMELYGRYCGGASKKEVAVGVSNVVPDMAVVSKADKIASLRGVIDDVMGGGANFVFPDGLDDIKDVVKEDYVKSYDDCEFDGDYRSLWERIVLDVDMSIKEKSEWKLKIGVR